MSEIQSELTLLDVMIRHVKKHPNPYLVFGYILFILAIIGLAWSVHTG